jgi:hypothetical protein
VVDLHFKRELYAEGVVGPYWVLDPRGSEVHQFGVRQLDGYWLVDVDLQLWSDA